MGSLELAHSLFIYREICMTKLQLDVVKVLVGHVDEFTAYLIKDYPYGRKLRCQKLMWIETNPKKSGGQRICSITTNPKSGMHHQYHAPHPLTEMCGNGGRWYQVNSIHASTYGMAKAMYLDSDGHVQISGLIGWEEPDVVIAWANTFREYVAVDKWAAETAAGIIMAGARRYSGNRQIKVGSSTTEYPAKFTPEKAKEYIAFAKTLLDPFKPVEKPVEVILPLFALA